MELKPIAKPLVVKPQAKKNSTFSAGLWPFWGGRGQGTLVTELLEEVIDAYPT